ncbi:MAG: (d)CMP kinase [Alphaproteobacteria bacterium]|nr:(d)CMP kinase [Alphaproteobacteria bacterium]
MIVAVDGPAAAGKGTLACKLAQHYGLAHLDTGGLYRAVALRVLRAHLDPTEPVGAEKAARALAPADLADPDLRLERTAEAASKVAVIPGVRAALLEFQRAFAFKPPGGTKGAVLDGRDIGTVVLPDADHKLFVTASPESRARRRWAELAAVPGRPSLAEIEGQVRERDARDRERAVSPLKSAPGAFLLDTTDLDIDAAFAAAKAYISGRN